MTSSTRPDRAEFDRYHTPNYNPAPFVPVRGQGSRVWDQAGRDYIDLFGGIAVTSLGHAHPRLVAALQDQASQLWHLSNAFTNEPALELARMLVERTFADRVYFCSSGLEANEAAFKLARRHAHNQGQPQKTKLIAARNAFHGRSLFTVSVGGTPAYAEGFGPLPGDIVHVPYDDISALEACIDDQTCAVILEPIQGEGGVRPPSPGYLAAVRALCDRHGALLILDEVQSGAGRTGTLYAYMHQNLRPDILTTAKGIGGGFPLGAMLCTETVGQSLVAGTHGSTYGGNPLACRVGCEVLKVFEDEKVLEGIPERSAALRAGLETLGQELGIFKEVRGQGMLLGAELVPELAGRARDAMQAAHAGGVLAWLAGANVVRLAPPLNIPMADIEEAIQRLRAAWSGLRG